MKETPKQILDRLARSPHLSDPLPDFLQKKESGSKKTKIHTDFSPEVQAIVQRTTLRIAGCDMAGVFLGWEKAAQDARRIAEVDTRIALDPAKIKIELAQYEKDLAAVGGDAAKVDKSKFTFSTTGGQYPPLTEQGLLNIWKKKNGFAIVAEYNDTLLAYNVGQASLPIDDSDDPNFDARNIGGNSDLVTWIQQNVEKILLNRRTGVDELFRRRGLSYFVKLVQAFAALDWKELIYFNIGTVKPYGRGISAAIGMRNVPSMEAVSEAYGEVQGIARTKVTPIMLGDERVADMHWTPYGQSPTMVVRKMLERGGILLRETQGYDPQKAECTGKILQNKLQQGGIEFNPTQSPLGSTDSTAIPAA